MKFNVYIQDSFVGQIDADNTGHALAIVAEKMKQKEFLPENENESPNVKVEPSNN
jgi:hypothetical protein